MFPASRQPDGQESTGAAACAGSIRRAFTLVELLVVAVLIMVLSSLALTGAAAARKRVRADSTRSTIRKIHEIVMPQYESYLRRRVPFVSGTNARTNALNRLTNTRLLMVREMPDSWGDVFANFAAVTSGSAFLRTGPVLAYAATKAAVGPTATAESAECLYVIVSQGLSEPDAMEQFRADEIGDTDKDGAFEFIDAWRQPIIFLRWAPGFSSASLVQKADPINFHDSLDPMRVDASGYALIPLIVSGGPDQQTGLQVTASGWAGLNMASIVSVAPLIGAPVSSEANANDYRDNITNHDLITK